MNASVNHSTFFLFLNLFIDFPFINLFITVLLDMIDGVTLGIFAGEVGFWTMSYLGSIREGGFGVRTLHWWWELKIIIIQSVNVVRRRH